MTGAILFTLTALAGPSARGTAFVEDFLSDIRAADRNAATAACAPDFRDRERLGCARLVDALLTPGTTVERGRGVYRKKSLLVEIWFSSPDGRLPFTLLAERRGKRWVFVDGDDGRGPGLSTDLTLEGVEHPSTPRLPEEIAGLFRLVDQDSIDLVASCAPESQDVCRQLAHQNERLGFRVNEAEERNGTYSVGALVDDGERLVDRIWFRFQRTDGVWRLVAIDEDGLRR